MNGLVVRDLHGEVKFFYSDLMLAPVHAAKQTLAKASPRLPEVGSAKCTRPCGKSRARVICRTVSHHCKRRASAAGTALGNIRELSMKVHVFELERLAVDAAQGRCDPAGDFAGLGHWLHQ